MSTTITASRAGDLRSLIKFLRSLGISEKHAEELAAVTDHLNAYEGLEGLHARAATFVAKNVEETSIQARLASGKQVSDSELIDFAAKTSVAGKNIGLAAQSVINTAQNTRVRSASDAMRSIFPALIEDIRGVLNAAGDEPAPALIRDIQNTLKGIDGIAGRNQCDFWCIYHAAEAKWVILDRDHAEALEMMNQAHAAEQDKKKREQERAVVRGARPARKQPRTLRRTPLPSSGYSNFPLSGADVAAYAASKAAGPQELTR